MAQTSKYHQWWVGGKEGLWPSSHPEARAAELDKAWAAGLQVAPSGRQELTIVAKLGHVTRRKGPGTLAPATGAPRSHLRRGRASPRDRRSLGTASSAPTAGATRPWPLGKRPAARRPSLRCPPPPKSRSPAGLTRTSVCRPSSQSHPSRSGPSRTAARIPRLPSGAAAPPRPALTPRPSADRTGDGAPTGPSEVTEVARLGPDLMGRVTF